MKAGHDCAGFSGRGGTTGLAQSLLSIMVEFWLLDAEAPQPEAAGAAAQIQQQQARAMRSLLSSSLLRSGAGPTDCKLGMPPLCPGNDHRLCQAWSPETLFRLVPEGL